MILLTFSVLNRCCTVITSTKSILQVINSIAVFKVASVEINEWVLQYGAITLRVLGERRKGYLLPQSLINRVRDGLGLKDGVRKWHSSDFCEIIIAESHYNFIGELSVFDTADSFRSFTSSVKNEVVGPNQACWGGVDLMTIDAVIGEPRWSSVRDIGRSASDSGSFPAPISFWY